MLCSFIVIYRCIEISLIINLSLLEICAEFTMEPKVTTPSRVEPLLLNAIRGEKIERPPVWLMRQAGRYMKAGRIANRFSSFENIYDYNASLQVI